MECSSLASELSTAQMMTTASEIQVKSDIIRFILSRSWTFHKAQIVIWCINDILLDKMINSDLDEVMFERNLNAGCKAQGISLCTD